MGRRMGTVFILYSKMSETDSGELSQELMESIQGIGWTGPVERRSYVEQSGKRNEQKWTCALQRDDLVFFLRPTREDHRAAMRSWGHCWEDRRIIVLHALTTEMMERLFFPRSSFWTKEGPAICMSGLESWPLDVVARLSDWLRLPHPWSRCSERLRLLGRSGCLSRLQEGHISPLADYLETNFNSQSLRQWVQELQNLVQPLIKELSKMLVTPYGEQRGQITSILAGTPLADELARAKAALARTEHTQGDASIAAVGEESEHRLHTQRHASRSVIAGTDHTSGETERLAAAGTTSQSSIGQSSTYAAAATAAGAGQTSKLQGCASSSPVSSGAPVGAGHARRSTVAGEKRGVYFRSNIAAVTAAATDSAQRGAVATGPRCRR